MIRRQDYGNDQTISIVHRIGFFLQNFVFFSDEVCICFQSGPSVCQRLPEGEVAFIVAGSSQGFMPQKFFSNSHALPLLDRQLIWFLVFTQILVFKTPILHGPPLSPASFSL